MNLLELITISPIADNCCKPFDIMAFDGDDFFFKRRCCKAVYRFNQYLEYIDYSEVCRDYECLTYDSTEECFWAADNNYNRMLYKLDRGFCEIDSVKIKTDDMQGANISNISYNCSNDTLMVSFDHGILELNKYGGQETLQINCKHLFLSVLSAPPNYLTAYLKKPKQYVSLYSEDNILINSEIISNDFTVQDMVLVNSNNELFLYMLALKNRAYSYVLKFRLPTI